MNFIKKMLFCLIFFAASNLSAGFECEVAVCAVFKDEGPYLREWVLFHMAQGVQRFYLYDNFSCDHMLWNLEDLVCSGIVKIIPWPFDYCDCRGFDEMRCCAYMNCIENIRNKVRWCAFLDCNEFLFLKSCFPLNVFLKKFKEYGAVAVNRQVFGTSNIPIAPCGKLIQTLFWKCHPKHNCCKAVKLIVQPKYVVSCISPRHFIFKIGKLCVNAKKKELIDGKCKDICVDKICINHYIFRDLKYYHTFLHRTICCYCHECCGLDFCFYDDCIIFCVPPYDGPCCPNN